MLWRPQGTLQSLATWSGDTNPAAKGDAGPCESGAAQMRNPTSRALGTAQDHDGAEIGGRAGGSSRRRRSPRPTWRRRHPFPRARARGKGWRGSGIRVLAPNPAYTALQLERPDQLPQQICPAGQQTGVRSAPTQHASRSPPQQTWPTVHHSWSRGQQTSGPWRSEGQQPPSSAHGPSQHSPSQTVFSGGQQTPAAVRAPSAQQSPFGTHAPSQHSSLRFEQHCS